MFSKTPNRTAGITAEEEVLPRPVQNLPTAEQGILFLQDFIAALSVAVEAMQMAELPNLDRGVDFYDEVTRFEKTLIKRALKLTNGNQSQAARLLNLNQTTLHGKLKQYKITPLVIIYDDPSVALRYE